MLERDLTRPLDRPFNEVNVQTCISLHVAVKREFADAAVHVFEKHMSQSQFCSCLYIWQMDLWPCWGIKLLDFGVQFTRNPHQNVLKYILAGQAAQIHLDVFGYGLDIIYILHPGPCWQRPQLRLGQVANAW